MNISWFRFALAACVAAGSGCTRSDRAVTPDESGVAPLGAPGAEPTNVAGAPAATAAADAGPISPAPSVATGPLNVLLILVDSLRADMPWAGYPREIAPNLTLLEKQSVSYTRGYSVSSYTAKSVAAMLSGKYPTSLKRSGYFFTKYPASNLFLAELLQAAGSHTLSAHAHAYMKRGNGMDQGFVDWKVVEGIDFDAQTDNHVTSQKLTPLVIAELEAVPKDKRFFAYVHYMDPHDQYIKHPEAPDFGKKTRDRYDQEVFYTDLHIGKLLDWCKTQPFWAQTAVIVSADHGEAFGEHKIFGHVFEVWDVLTHVPLFFYLPGAAPRRIDTPRSHIDVAPTVLDLMQVKAESDFIGTSLVAELRGAKAEQRPVLVDLPQDSNNSERRAMILGNHKLLVFGNDYRFELYDLANDPGELKNLAKQQPDKLAELKRVYSELWAKVPKVKPFGGNKMMDGGFANGPAE